MNFEKNKKKLILIILICAIHLLFSCNTSTKESNLAQGESVVETESQTIKKIDYKYYDVLDISPAKIIIPKNQTISQSLSILVNDGYGNLVVFDGGRVEDADYLCDIIKDNGGVVKTWFITHIHDDHIGALYKILIDKRTDIEIKELYYNFASFDWYYEKMGNDAGIYYLFENAIKDYNDNLKSINKEGMQILDKNTTKNIDYMYKGENTINISILNNLYMLDQDPINNTSIVYYVSMLNNKANMMIFGDLGYEGGNKLFEFLDRNDDVNLAKNIYSSHILVLAHHGQNGIDPELYKKFKPKVIVWPTSNDIYANTHGRYYTNDTKKVLSKIKSIKYQIKSYEETAVIR